MKILLVEDHTAISKAMKRFLTIKGFECDVAPDGKTGLSMIRTDVYDVILLDLALPEMSGLEIIDELYEKNEIAKYHIVVNTASILDDTIKEDILNKGIIELLPKPTRPELLLGVLEKIHKHTAAS